MKFKFGDKVIVQLHQGGILNKRKRKAIYIKPQSASTSYVYLKNNVLLITKWCFNVRIEMDYAGIFTLKNARGGFRYNVVGLNGEPITTSEVLKAKQSATDMHEKHFRQYHLIDKTKPRAK